MSKYLEKIGFEEIARIGELRGYVTEDDVVFFMPRFMSNSQRNRTREKLKTLDIEIRKSEKTLFLLAERIQEEKGCGFEEALFEANIIESDIEERKRTFRRNYFVLGFVLSRYGCVALIILIALTISVPLVVFFTLMSGPAGP